MSLNNSMNSVIALLEGRPALAKDILRRPTSDVTNVPEVMSRLDRAVNKRVAKELKVILMDLMRLQAPTNYTTDACEYFYEGVAAVEAQLELFVVQYEGSSVESGEDSGYRP